MLQLTGDVRTIVTSMLGSKDPIAAMSTSIKHLKPQIYLSQPSLDRLLTKNEPILLKGMSPKQVEDVVTLLAYFICKYFFWVKGTYITYGKRSDLST